jgi:hypothetical protein
MKAKRGRRDAGRHVMMMGKRTLYGRGGMNRTEEVEGIDIVLGLMNARKADGAQEDLVMVKTEFLLGIDVTDREVVTSWKITMGIDIDDTTAVIRTLHTDGDVIGAVPRLLDIRAGNGLKRLQNPTVMLQKAVSASHRLQHHPIIEKLNFVANSKLNTRQGMTRNKGHLIAALVVAVAVQLQIPIP